MSKVNEVLEQMDKLAKQVNDNVWEVFHKYIKATKFRFSDPERWHIFYGEVVFTGDDGCMGHYERQSLEIPIEFFDESRTDELIELAVQQQKEADEKIVNNRQAEQEAKELKELNRLKEKYDINDRY